MWDKLLQVIPLLFYYPRPIQVLVGITVFFMLASIIALLIYLPAATTAKKRIAHIEFKDEPSFVTHQEVYNQSINKGWTAYFYNVSIFNGSYESAIKVDHLELSDFEMLEGDHYKPWENAEPFTVEWNGRMGKNISPRGKVFTHFARVYPPYIQQILDSNWWTGPHDIPQLRFMTVLGVGQMPMKMISKISEGTHRFRLTAYFDNSPPATAKFELVCPPEKGRTTAEALVKEIKIKMLKSEE